MAMPSGPLTIETFGARLRAGDLTASEVTEACLRRIADDDKRLNAFILVTADDAREQARRADAELAAGVDRGPLHGVPLSLKDLLDVRGTPTTAASRVREGHRARGDAAVVTQLRQAGAVLVGKTNLHEFAFGTTNEESAFGAAHHPRDVTRSPGGSSGGSAISVIARMALGTIGTDTGGSIRIPAALCGLVGLKPAAGDVSTDGVVPLSKTLDHVGPIARSVMDAWLLYRVLRGQRPSGPIDRGTDRPIDTLRLGVLRRDFCASLDDEVRARFDEALDRLRAAGARIDDVVIPHTREIAPAYVTIVFSDAAAYHAATLDSVPDRYSRPVRLRLEAGRYLLAEDLSRALRAREILRHEVDDAMAGVDALVLPTVPIPAPLLGATTIQLGQASEPVRNVMLRQTQLFNLTGHPAITVPSGTTAAGLPAGLQLVGARANTEGLLRVALTCEPLIGTSS